MIKLRKQKNKSGSVITFDNFHVNPVTLERDEFFAITGLGPDVYKKWYGVFWDKPNKKYRIFSEKMVAALILRNKGLKDREGFKELLKGMEAIWEFYNDKQITITAQDKKAAKDSLKGHKLNFTPIRYRYVSSELLIDDPLIREKSSIKPRKPKRVRV